MKKLISLFFFCICFLTFSQTKDNNDIKLEGKIDTINIEILERNPLKASLYSAVLPGLGQFYNKKYWKIPIIWGGIGTGIAVITFYNNQYNRYRDAFISSLNGETHEFSEVGLTKEILARAQNDQRRNRDYAIVLTSLVYILNIIDATVDAHLSIFEKDKDLAFEPIIIQNPANLNTSVGLSFSINF